MGDIAETFVCVPAIRKVNNQGLAEIIFPRDINIIDE